MSNYAQSKHHVPEKKYTIDADNNWYPVAEDGDGIFGIEAQFSYSGDTIVAIKLKTSSGVQPINSQTVDYRDNVQELFIELEQYTGFSTESNEVEIQDLNIPFKEDDSFGTLINFNGYPLQDFPFKPERRGSVYIRRRIGSSGKNRE
ncbi:MAG: hypothetical protein WBA16_06555 [Nonlabens sp.]